MLSPERLRASIATSVEAGIEVFRFDDGLIRSVRAYRDDAEVSVR